MKSEAGVCIAVCGKALTPKEKRKQVCYALHVSCYFDRIVAFGITDFLHSGGVDSCVAGHRHRGRLTQSYQRTKGSVIGDYIVYVKGEPETGEPTSTVFTVNVVLP